MLNCRRAEWRGLRQLQGPEACALVARALRLSCELCALLEDEATQAEANMHERLRQFFDLTCELKHVDLGSLLQDGVRFGGGTERQALAFFLNLYHLLINHAYLLLGPPPSKFAWLSYYTTVAYHVGDELVSLAGLEHCILRAPMSAPVSLVGGLIIPTSRYSCALTKPDARLNFNLNCGSFSSPPHVPVYRPEALDAQLEAMSRRFLTERASLGADGKSLILPSVLQLFSRDFGGKGGAKATPAELVRYAASFVDDPAAKQRLLDALQSSFLGPSIRFAAFDFRCRTLALLTDRELGVI